MLTFRNNFDTVKRQSCNKGITMMDNSLNLQGSLTFTSSSQITEICLPLRTLGITGFQYSKRFTDGSRILLTDLPELIEFHYQPDIYPLTWYDNDGDIEAYHTGWEFSAINCLFNSIEQNRLCKKIYEIFKISYGIFYLHKQKNHVEIFCFMSEDPAIFKLNLKILLHFILYFKDRAQKIIKQFHTHKIMIPVQKLDDALNKNDAALSLLQNIPIHKYYLFNSNSNQYLTSREMSCLKWCTHGKTSAEISILLNISISTVESHLQNIKQKLDCYKQSQLAGAAIKQGINID